MQADCSVKTLEGMWDILKQRKLKMNYSLSIMCTYCTKLKCTRTSEGFSWKFYNTHLSEMSDESFPMLHTKYDVQNYIMCIFQEFKNLMEAKLMEKPIRELVNYLLEWNFNLLIVLCCRINKCTWWTDFWCILNSRKFVSEN